MSDDVDVLQEMPITLTWLGMHGGEAVPCKPLPHYTTNWLRNVPGPLMCKVFKVSPRIPLPWHYDETEDGHRYVWECGSVWLHVASGMEGDVADLQVALQHLKSSVKQAQYTLLVDRNGMSYDSNRFGGDHQVAVPSGRRFTLSVRSGEQAHAMILLAIDWGIF